MELDPRSKELIHLANEYHRLSGLSVATIATKVMNDGKFFDRISSGAGFTIRTYDKVKNWFQEHTPKIQDTASNPASPASQH